MDTNQNGELTRDGKPGHSVHHSLFTNIKIISEKDKLEFDHDGRDKKKPRSSKGKGPSLNEKVSGADIKGWVIYNIILEREIVLFYL